jgi:hypothetical protein
LAALFSLLLAETVPWIAADAKTPATTPRTSRIQGTVVDQRTGLTMSHATVMLERGNIRIATTATDANGRYSFSNAAPGIHNLEITAEGLGTSRSDDIVASAGKTVQLNSADSGAMPREQHTVSRSDVPSTQPRIAGNGGEVLGHRPKVYIFSE